MIQMPYRSVHIPQYLSTDAYSAIVTGQTGNGNSYGGHVTGQGEGGYRGG